MFQGKLGKEADAKNKKKKDSAKGAQSPGKSPNKKSAKGTAPDSGR